MIREFTTLVRTTSYQLLCLTFYADCMNEQGKTVMVGSGTEAPEIKTECQGTVPNSKWDMTC